MADGNGKETTEVSQLSKEQKLALFEAWEKAQEKAAAADVKVSEAVKKICEACGSGPFKFRGNEFRLVKARGREVVELRRANLAAEEIG